VHDLRHSRLTTLTRAELIKDESPLYLFDSQFGEKVPTLLEEYQVPRHNTRHIQHRHSQHCATNVEVDHRVLAQVPEYFREDLFAAMGSTRPDYRWVIVGPPRSGSAFHQGKETPHFTFRERDARAHATSHARLHALLTRRPPDASVLADPNRTAAWNALISGRKRWIMFPPHVLPPGVEKDEHGNTLPMYVPSLSRTLARSLLSDACAAPGM
jgi:hypothetical protein